MSTSDPNFFFFNDTATTEIYTLSLHDALPISPATTTTCSGPPSGRSASAAPSTPIRGSTGTGRPPSAAPPPTRWPADRSRSEEHTSELQSRQYLVCRLLLEKKKILQSLYSPHY